MMIKQCNSYPVTIFIAGDASVAKNICREFCDDVGLCVTVTSTTYIYTGGEEDGVIVGLINYPRFPSKPEDIVEKAELLARKLLTGLKQQSYSIQTTDKTTLLSWREEPHP